MPAPLPGGSGAELSRAERQYLHELVARLDRLVSGLIGVYLFGSGAYGDHDPARSDLDVAAGRETGIALLGPPVSEVFGPSRHRSSSRLWLSR